MAGHEVRSHVPLGNEKGGIGHNEELHDHDLAKIDTAEIYHLGHLSEEELVLEKQLKRKIDSLIMPLVILVGQRDENISKSIMLLLPRATEHHAYPD